MNQVKKHRRILVLMITSQVLLTVFVAQWLRSQYQSEKKILTEKLNELYITTQDEIIDTLLFKVYVNPVLKSTITTGKDFEINENTGTDSMSIHTGDLRKGTVKWQGSKAAITVNLHNTTDSTFPISDTIRIRHINDDMLMRSVKMIVAHSVDSTRAGQPVTETITLTPDTAIFRKHFHNYAVNSGMDFDLVWQKKGDTVRSIVRKKSILINPFNPFSLPGVEIESYGPYLTGMIFPQILFGFLLIIITALAFTVSYRNIRSQAVLNNLRNEFVSNITHELKTPVATLGVALESLGRYNMRNEPQRMEEYLKLAGLETKRLEELINRILDNSLLESGKQALDKKLININSLILEVAEESKHRIEGTGTIEVIINEDPLTISGDPLFLKGVILNLIDNSIRYCEKRPEIKIIAGKEANIACVRVIDNGPGIPEEYQKKIFEKFFRLPSSNIHNVKGYGLGLSFAYQVIKLHEGSIEVKNLEQGCLFIIKLPLS